MLDGAWFSAHPHMSLDLPSISSLSTEPILFAQVPAFDTVHDKLVSFIDNTPSVQNSSALKDDLEQTMFPWLKERYAEKSKATATSPEVVAAFGQTVTALAAELPAASMFPLLDIWRLAILEPTIAPVTLAPLVQVVVASGDQRPRHVHFPIASRLRRPGQGSAHGRARTVTTSPRSACASGSGEPGIQRRCVGTEGPSRKDQRRGGRGQWPP